MWLCANWMWGAGTTRSHGEEVVTLPMSRQLCLAIQLLWSLAPFLGS